LSQEFPGGTQNIAGWYFELLAEKWLIVSKHVNMSVLFLFATASSARQKGGRGQHAAIKLLLLRKNQSCDL
jgi:hypothetical protein